MFDNGVFFSLCPSIKCMSLTQKYLWNDFTFKIKNRKHVLIRLQITAFQQKVGNLRNDQTEFNKTFTVRKLVYYRLPSHKLRHIINFE